MSGAVPSVCGARCLTMSGAVCGVPYDECHRAVRCGVPYDER